MYFQTASLLYKVTKHFAKTIYHQPMGEDSPKVVF